MPLRELHRPRRRTGRDGAEEQRARSRHNGVDVILDVDVILEAAAPARPSWSAVGVWNSPPRSVEELGVEELGVEEPDAACAWTMVSPNCCCATSL